MSITGLVWKISSGIPFAKPQGMLRLRLRTTDPQPTIHSTFFITFLV